MNFVLLQDGTSLLEQDGTGLLLQADGAVASAFRGLMLLGVGA